MGRMVPVQNMSRDTGISCPRLSTGGITIPAGCYPVAFPSLGSLCPSSPTGLTCRCTRDEFALPTSIPGSTGWHLRSGRLLSGREAFAPLALTALKLLALGMKDSAGAAAVQKSGLRTPGKAAKLGRQEGPRPALSVCRSLQSLCPIALPIAPDRCLLTCPRSLRERKPALPSSLPAFPSTPLGRVLLRLRDPRTCQC